MTKTNVMRLLDSAKIPYRTAEYAYDENDLGGMHAAAGIGMPPETVAMLLTEHVPISKGSGVGLINVNERIRLYAGEGYGVEIQSELDVGTTVTLHLPARPYREGADK